MRSWEKAKIEHEAAPCYGPQPQYTRARLARYHARGGRSPCDPPATRARTPLAVTTAILCSVMRFLKVPRPMRPCGSLLPLAFPSLTLPSAPGVLQLVGNCRNIRKYWVTPLAWITVER
jgi:hypothetical protein